MSYRRRVALWLVRTACSRRHVEEIEGDLLELHERRGGRDRKRPEWMLLLQAIRAILGRPSVGLRRLALAITGAGVAVIAYVALVLSQPERSWFVWIIALGVAIESLFWVLMLFEMRDRAGQSS